MKRDMDLVRKILFACETHEHGFEPQPLTITGHTDEQIGYHVALMAEAGLVDAQMANSSARNKSPYALIRSVTWTGYEFLDAARNDDTWAKAKSAVGRVAGVGFEVVKNVLVAYGTQQATKMIG
jgi:hypothetical protein